MAYYNLVYHLASDYMTKREPVRASHFAHLKPYFDRGEVIMGGAHEDIGKGALIIFKVDNEQIIMEFVEQDPYVLEGVVTSYEINKWNVAIGNK